MIQVTFKKPNGEIVSAEANAGDSLMSVAVNAGIDEVAAECGGSCTCATCHVHVAPDWMGKVGPANEHEADMLMMEGGVDEFSRLSCQVILDESHQGLMVEVAPL